MDVIAQVIIATGFIIIGSFLMIFGIRNAIKELSKRDTKQYPRMR
jgi:hypothetical protein